MTVAFAPTAEQQRIIDHPLEPLRVAAGAGTGKTATVVERLASAIGDGLDPEAALGITFTNKAAGELADRLRYRLPVLAAEGREVEVSTYHGFALRILTEFGALVGVERDLAVIGPGYVRQLLHESVGSEPYRHIDITALAHRIDDAATLGAQVAANLLDPGNIVAPDPPDDTWQQRMELIRILGNYQDTKRRLGIVDFGDLIRLAYRVVHDHPDIAARIRARYRIVVLDEYQDTDPGQRRLLQAIFGAGFPITAVGDADQTIYEWRGASLDNFIGFVHHFPRAGNKLAKTLALTTNRRSGPTILDVANGIRGLLHGGVTRDPLRPAATVDDHVGYGWFRTAADEAAWIAGEMWRLHVEHGLAWRDMAVLFRRHRSIAPVRTALAAADIPFEVVSLGGLIEVPEVADVHAWLRILARPDDSVALTRILLGSRYRLGLGEVAPLARWVRAHEPGRHDPDLEVPYPLMEAVDRWDEPDTDATAADHALIEFRWTYRRLLADAQQTTLVELIRRIIDAIDGWTEVAAMPAVAGLTARLNLYRFLDLAEGWSPLAGRPSLEGFLGYLDVLADEATAAELDTATVGGEDAVSLLTVHRAKGLEWDTVFVPALAKNVFPSKSFGFDDPRGRPRWLPYEFRLDADSLPSLDGRDDDVRARLQERHRQGELRTAYVAVTRAKRRLFMTGAVWDRPMRPYDPSELLELVRRVDGTKQIAWVAEPGDRPDAPSPVQPIDGPDPHFERGWRDLLRQAVDHPGPPHPAWDPDVEPARHQLTLMLDNLPTGPPPAPPPPPATSVTGLVTLASCPQRFYWNEVDPLPRRPASWLRRGAETHRRIELHHQGVRAFADLEPDAPPTGEVPGDARIDPFAVFRRSRFADVKPRLTETPIDLTLAGVRVRGRIDAVFEPELGWWEIIDWKSGRRPDDPSAVVQLQAYATAAARGGVVGDTPQRISAGFVYLGSDPAEEVLYRADRAWLEEAEERLVALASRVTGDEFEATPSAACFSCDFLNVCGPGRAHVAKGG